MLTEMMNDLLIDVLLGRYSDAKEGMRTQLSHMLGEVIVDIMLKRKINLLLSKNIYTLN